MSFLSVMPEQIESAAQDLAGIRSALVESSAVAAAPTTAVMAAAQDEVSAAIAAMFGAYGEQYQVLSAQAASFHDEFVKLLNAGAGAYLSTEIANAESNLLNAVIAPVQTLLGHPSALAGAEDIVTRITAAWQAVEPSIAKGGAELLLAGQTALTGVTQLEPAFADLVQAGNYFVAAGTDAVAGLTALGTAATELIEGVSDIAMAAGSAIGGVGLLANAVVDVFNPATLPLVIPSALGGLGLLGTAGIELIQGVHYLTLVGPNMITGITDLERAYGEFTQGVSFVQLAEQDAAPGLATLQIAENEFVAGVTDVQTGVDAAVAVLRA